MRALLTIRAAIDRLNAFVGTAVSWLVLLMVGVGAFNALARYVGPSLGLNLASNAWLELQWYLFSLVFLLGAADVLRRDAHVRVDVLHQDRRPVRAVIDGQALEAVRAVDVGFSDEHVQLAYFDDHDFTSRMVGKILLS